MTKRERILIVLNFILLGIILAGGSGLEPAVAKEKSDQALFDQIKIFTEVLAKVERDYVYDVDVDKLMAGAIKGMLAALDPHSGYHDPESFKELQVQTTGQFGGLGIEITIKDGMLIVVSPMEGSPAAKAGIRSGDAIVKIGGKFTKEFSLVDAVKKLRGPKGSEIKISVYRKDTPDLLEFKLLRDIIEVRSVRGRYLGDGYAWLRINQFVEKTSEDLKKEIQKIKNASNGEVKGVILDLRNNPGGLLTQAVRVVDTFIDEGVIVYTQGKDGNQDQKFYAHGRGNGENYPLVILVNGGSASAAEIVSGALKEHGRALIVGEVTFGKGSVQTVGSLSNGGALTLTTSLYYLKNGDSIQGSGVTPDVEIPVVYKDDNGKASIGASLFPKEIELEGAIANPDQKSTAKRRKVKEIEVSSKCLETEIEKDPLKQVLACDPQFEKAFSILKGFDSL